jgi:hypothetical protein
MDLHDKGNWVLWHDYEKLADEHRRLKIRLERVLSILEGREPIYSELQDIQENSENLR